MKLEKIIENCGYDKESKIYVDGKLITDLKKRIDVTKFRWITMENDLYSRGCMIRKSTRFERIIRLIKKLKFWNKPKSLVGEMEMKKWNRALSEKEVKWLMENNK